MPSEKYPGYHCMGSWLGSERISSLVSGGPASQYGCYTTIINLLLTEVTFLLLYAPSSSLLFSLGKEEQNSVCDNSGREDEVVKLEATSHDVLEVPDTSVLLCS
jgi:hypothetical protein